MPARILYHNKIHPLADGENVLSCLLRAGHSIPYSCRSGMCHSCLMKVEDGAIPEDAQYGLPENLRSQNFFLACQCYPGGDMKVVLCKPEKAFSYREGDKDCLLLLIGIGKGLAQLYQIACVALEQGHKGHIHFYHCVQESGDLYLVNELEALALHNNNFLYIPCVAENEAALDIIMAGIPAVNSKPQFYLCGEQESVNSLRIKIFEAGISNIDIHVDDSSGC